MLVIDDLYHVNLDRETILTIGSFDGVHRGHQHLIGQVVQRAREKSMLAGAVTFYPHPRTVLTPHNSPPYLTTLGEQIALLEKLELDLLTILAFDRQLAQTSAQDFVEALRAHLRLKELWIGAGFALGRNRQGTLPVLKALGRQLGFGVMEVEPLKIDGEPISSTRIREHLAAGEVRQAAALLGRLPSLSGEVIAGARRGQLLGFPTANLAVRPERSVPANGVYAVYAILGRARYPAVANVGVRPSFDNGERTVETHILDFDREIYGVDLVVEFVERLRDERKFNHIEDLLAQIGRDVERARRILTGAPGRQKKGD
jgi:riboflavin kinase/FMN adenylyltransferase